MSATSPDKQGLHESGDVYRKEPDSTDNYNLYNGRVWRSLYARVRGDEFLFIGDFQPGTVKLNDKLFNNVEVRYDIYHDEVLIRKNQGIILQLNKEMVNSFTIDFNNKTYYFQNMGASDTNEINGYVNILYQGDVSLLVKYKKEIFPLAVENRYDLFSQSNRMFLRKDGLLFSIGRKNDIIKLFEADKQQIRSFIKSRKLKVSKKKPESFVPVVDFCNSLYIR